jgi:phosphate transport system permease protein
MTGVVAAAEPGLGRTSTRKRVEDRGFSGLLWLSIAVAVGGLIVLLVYVFSKGIGSFGPNLWNNYPSVLNPETAGARSAIFGTLWVIGVTAVVAVPIGIGAAVYLEEFAAKDRWYNRTIELNILNLAAVPSIIYGILGLAFFARGPLDLGFVVLAGGLTLALLVLPIVIIASREAIRSVPSSIRDGALALGATQLQTVRKQVLPAAIPGIATAVILALSRAIGEAAPLILLGAATYVPFTPTGLESSFTVLPVQIFNWVDSPKEELVALGASAALLLVMVLLAMNSVAIWLRNRYQRKW